MRQKTPRQVLTNPSWAAGSQPSPNLGSEPGDLDLTSELQAAVTGVDNAPPRGCYPRGLPKGFATLDLTGSSRLESPSVDKGSVTPAILPTTAKPRDSLPGTCQNNSPKYVEKKLDNAGTACYYAVRNGNVNGKRLLRRP